MHWTRRLSIRTGRHRRSSPPLAVMVLVGIRFASAREADHPLQGRAAPRTRSRTTTCHCEGQAPVQARFDLERTRAQVRSSSTEAMAAAAGSTARRSRRAPAGGSPQLLLSGNNAYRITFPAYGRCTHASRSSFSAPADLGAPSGGTRSHTGTERVRRADARVISSWSFLRSMTSPSHRRRSPQDGTIYFGTHGMASSSRVERQDGTLKWVFTVWRWDYARPPLSRRTGRSTSAYLQRHLVRLQHRRDPQMDVPRARRSPCPSPAIGSDGTVLLRVPMTR